MCKFLLLILLSGILISARGSSDTIESRYKAFECNFLLSQSKFHLDHSAKQQLEHIYEKNLLQVSKELEQQYGKFPSTLSTNGMTFHVLRYLGAGQEAVIYQVERENRIFALKLWNTNSLEENLNSLAKLGREGTPVLEPLSIDGKNRIVVFPFLRLVSVYDALASSLMDSANPFHVLASSKFINAVAKNYQDREISKIQRDTMIDVDTGKFIVIDPFGFVEPPSKH